MGERSERPIVALRLVLDFGESVELDGSTVLEPDGGVVPAVGLRMPPHRAAYVGKVLAAYTRVCRLVGVELDAAERGPAWALTRAASAAGFVDAASPAVPSRVTSAGRMAAWAALRESEDFDDVSMIAVVDAAARWLEEPDGDEYAYALLGAVTDGPTQLRAYGGAARHGRWRLMPGTGAAKELKDDERAWLLEVGMRVRLGRVRARESQDVLAARAGVSRVTLGSIERGDHAAGVFSYVRLARALSLSLDELLGGAP